MAFFLQGLRRYEKSLFYAKTPSTSTKLRKKSGRLQSKVHALPIKSSFSCTDDIVFYSFYSYTHQWLHSMVVIWDIISFSLSSSCISWELLFFIHYLKIQLHVVCTMSALGCYSSGQQCNVTEANMF